MKLTIYGASDDLIEIEGDIREEFNPIDESSKLAFSDGTVLSVSYTDGCWRINRLAKGTSEYSKIESEGADSDNYSDKVTLVGDIKWVVFGSQMVKAKE